VHFGFNSCLLNNSLCGIDEACANAPRDTQEKANSIAQRNNAFAIASSCQCAG
jgi:hypothetical protein